MLLLILADNVPSTADDVRQATPSAAEIVVDTTPRTKRVLLVISQTSEKSLAELRRLESDGGPFDLLKQRGWKIGRGPENHIQIVDISVPVEADISQIIAERSPTDSPLVVCIEEGEIVRSFQRGCTTPLDQWTFGWMMTGNDERPVAYAPEPVQVATTGNYPLRGNHWSVEGNWNPTREYVIHHLRSIHSNQLQADWNIESWSIEELRSVHDDLHDREEGFRGRYASNSTSRASSNNGSRPASTSSGGVRKPGKASR